MDPVKIVVDDITRLRTEAIVNAANERLAGGGGVDGAIHRAAGPELMAACRAIGGCPTGQAVLTGGFRLHAKYVIHTVGPVYSDGRRGEAEVLAACYRNSLTLASEHGVESIAFPCISTGVYGYPQEEAASIALRELGSWSRTGGRPVELIVCCFSDADAEVYQRISDASN